MLLLAVYTYINTILCEVYYYFKLDIQWYWAFIAILANTLLVWEGNRLAEPFLRKKLLAHRGKIRFLAFFFILGNIIAAVSTIGVIVLVGQFSGHPDLSSQLVPIKLNLIYAGLVNLFFHLLNTIFFFFREYKQQLEEAEALRRNTAQAQLQLIKSQINPHFLFNNLNVLSALVMKDNPEANVFIEEFSTVYRYILNNQDKELVPLSSELEYIQPYISLLQKRFPRGLKVNIDIPERYPPYYVIPAAMQMLIENAIKHNVASANKPLLVDIHLNGNQTLVVSNNFQPKQSMEPSTQFGLKNIMKRYEVVSGKEVEVQQSAAAFSVSLPLLLL
jgi:two-component system, LytTR family, sensor kinase